MAQFDPSRYDDVNSRLAKFWEAHPNGRVHTKLLSDPNQLETVVVQAEIYADREDPRPVSTGLAFEAKGENYKAGANFTHHLENAETSAIGRAFANWVFKASKARPRPSRQEIDKANRMHEEEAEPRRNANAPKPLPPKPLPPKPRPETASEARATFEAKAELMGVPMDRPATAGRLAILLLGYKPENWTVAEWMDAATKPEAKWREAISELNRQAVQEQRQEAAA